MFQRYLFYQFKLHFCNSKFLFFIRKSWEDFDNKIIDWIHGEGSAVLQRAFLYDFELEWGRWYRSKDKRGGESPFCSVMINKKWWLEEEFNNLILQIHQVDIRSLGSCLIILYIDFVDIH